MLKSSPSPIPYLIATAVLLAGGAWWFYDQPSPTTVANPPTSPQLPSSTPVVPPAFPAPTAVAANTTVKIDGATSMVAINQKLKTAFEAKFSGTEVVTQSGGSDKGLSQLLAGQVDLAAVSRPLAPAEVSQGLTAVSIATDPIAIVVGVNNPFAGNLTPAQAIGIFNGSINNWSQVGGPNRPIRVINRPTVSGTRQVFQDLVLKGSSFGLSPNFVTLQEDATTPLLRALEGDGIGYATYSQVIDQKTVRAISISGINPLQPNYPYGRSLLYVYKKPPSPAVQAFLGYGLSPDGQRAIRAD